MFRNSTTIHPLTIHQGRNPLCPGDEDLSTIKSEKDEETLMDVFNNGRKTMKQVYRVISKDESPHPQQDRFQLQTTVKLPSVEFCLNQALPDMNLVLQFQDEVKVLKIDLHKFLQPEQSHSQQLLQNAWIETNGTRDIVNTSTTDSSPAQLTPPHSSPSGSGIQHPIPTRVSPQRKLGPGAPRPTLRNKTKVTRTQVKVNPRVGGLQPLNRSTKDKAGWRYPCYFCHKRFKAPYHLNIHLLGHTGEKPYPCDKCGKQFNHKSNLAQHQRLHYPATRHPFSCEECGKTFTQKGSLINHEKFVHRGLKEFGCPECDRKFGIKPHMITHLNSFHFRIRIPCPKPNCGKSFSNKSGLTYHQNHAHPKTISSNNTQLDE